MGLYVSEWKRLFLNGEIQSTARLSLLPGPGHGGRIGAEDNRKRQGGLVKADSKGPIQAGRPAMNGLRGLRYCPQGRQALGLKVTERSGEENR